MMSLLLRRDNLTEFDVGLQKLLKKQNSELVLMEPWAYSTAAIFLFFIGFFGFSFNLTAIILMCKDIQVSIFAISVYIVEPFK